MRNSDRPIATQEEADKAFEFLVVTTMDVLKIKRLDAELRVDALFKSGILNQGHPDDRTYQMMIDIFLTSPQWKTPEYQARIERLEATR